MESNNGMESRYSKSTISSGSPFSASPMGSYMGTLGVNTMIFGKKQSETTGKRWICFLAGQLFGDPLDSLLSENAISNSNIVLRKLKQDFMSEMRYLSRLRHPCITVRSKRDCL